MGKLNIRNKVIIWVLELWLDIGINLVFDICIMVFKFGICIIV